MAARAKKKTPKKRASERSRPWPDREFIKQYAWQAAIVAAVGGIVAAGLTLFGTWISGIFSTDPGPTVALTAGGDVPQTFLVEGEAARIPEDGEFWLVVDEADGSQAAAVMVELAKEASGDELAAWPPVEVAVGGPDDAGRTFNIRAVLTDTGQEIESGDTLSSLTVRRISPPKPEPVVYIDITTVVERQLILKGTAAAIPEDGDVWLIVEHGDQWFPQGESPLTLGPGAASLKGDGWEREVLVGQEGDEGKTFAILAVLTDGAGTDLIEQHIQEFGFEGMPADHPIRDRAEKLAVALVRRTEAPLSPDVQLAAAFANVSADVPQEFPAIGAISGLPSGDHAWIAVGFDDLLWLHGDPVVGTGDDLLSFAVPVVVGGPDERGVKFSLVVLRASASRSGALAAWRDTSVGAGLPADDPLLENVDRLATVTVTRG